MARDIDAEQAKSPESTGESLLDLDLGRVDIDHYAMDASLFERRSRMCQKRIEQTQSLIEVAAHKFPVRLLKTQPVGQLMLTLPEVVAEKSYSGGEIIQRGCIGRRGFRPATCNQ